MDPGQALEILGLRPSATITEVKEAWRDLAKVWHPDRFATDPRLRQKAGEKLKEINEAYQFLQNHGTPQSSGSSNSGETLDHQRWMQKIKETLTQAITRMVREIDDLHVQQGTRRTSHDYITLLEHLKVDYYGTTTPLNQVATVEACDASMISVQPWDPSLLGGIEEVIRFSPLGLNPLVDGKILRVPITLMEERRKELLKQLHQLIENHHIAIRKIRCDSNEELRLLRVDKKISADDEYRRFEEIQKLTDEIIGTLEGRARSKQREIMEDSAR